MRFGSILEVGNKQMALSQSPPSALDTEDVGFWGAPRFCVSGVTLLQGRHREVPEAPQAHGTQILFPAWGIPDPVPISPYSHTHTNAQANSRGAGMFKWCHHSHLGHRHKQLQKSVNGLPGLGEEGWLLVAPQAIPGPLQGHSPQLTQLLPACHTPRTITPPPTTPPHPTATQLHQPPSLSLPHPPRTAPQRKSSTFASQLCRSLSSPITPLGGRTRSKSLPLLEFTAHPIPHRPAVLPGRGPSCCPSLTPEPTAATKGLPAGWL